MFLHVEKHYLSLITHLCSRPGRDTSRECRRGMPLDMAEPQPATAASQPGERCQAQPSQGTLFASSNHVCVE